MSLGYGKEHYAANRQRYIDQARTVKHKVRLQRTAYLIAYFDTNPCVDCGERDPVVLELDHLRDTSFSIGFGLTQRRWQRILEEIDKCEVVCANCHRRRTARRRGSVRMMLAKGRGGCRGKSGRPDSNRHSELGRLSCNRYTTPARSAPESRRVGGQPLSHASSFRPRAAWARPWSVTSVMIAPSS